MNTNVDQELAAYREYSAALAEMARKFASEYPEATQAIRDVDRELQATGKQIMSLETLEARQK